MYWLKSVCSSMVVSFFLLQTKVVGNRFDTSDESREKPIFFSLPGNRTQDLNSAENSDLVGHMSASMQRELNKVRNKEEFAEFFNVLTSRSGLSRVGSDGAAEEAVNAGCSPIKTPVALNVSKEPSVTYYPSCVLLERCGGCCLGNLLSCQPVTVETVNLKIMKVSSSASTSGTRARQEAVEENIIVKQERHLKCDCKCILKKEDCDQKLQSYNENECSCQCLDRDGQAACYKKQDTHYWDNKICSCLCRTVLECSSGLYFDEEECGCKNSLFGPSLRTIDFNRIHNDSPNMNSADNIILMGIMAELLALSAYT